MKPIARRQFLRGFTVIEMMAVIGISAILTLMGTPIVLRAFNTSPGAQDLEILRGAFTALRNATILNNTYCSTVTVDMVNNLIDAVVYGTCPKPGYIPANPITTTTYKFANIAISNFNTGATLQFIPGGGTNANTLVTMPVTMNSDGTLYVL